MLQIFDHDDDDLDDFDERDAEDADERVRIRAPERDYPADPAVWLESHTMTRTEVALRFTRFLLTQRLVTGDVQVSLTGYELTRRERPKFPVHRFLRDRGCAPIDDSGDWRCIYKMNNAPFALSLNDHHGTADVVAPLAEHQRLVAHVSRGCLVHSRSSAEHKVVCSTVGRAVGFEHYLPGDVAAVVVPRSPAYRKLAAAWRERPIVKRAGLLILTVDRTGNADWPISGQ